MAPSWKVYNMVPDIKHGLPLDGHGSHHDNTKHHPLHGHHEPTLFNLKRMDTSHIKAQLKESTVGRRGEEWAWLYLKWFYGERATVTWMNGERESHQPYDVVVAHGAGGTQYVEVKATKERSYRTRFVATHNELVHARRNRYNTEFYFVVNALADRPELYHVTNWNDHWAIRRPEDKMPKEMRFEKDSLRVEAAAQPGILGPYDAAGLERLRVTDLRQSTPAVVWHTLRTRLPVFTYPAELLSLNLSQSVSLLGPYESCPYRRSQQMIHYHQI